MTLMDGAPLSIAFIQDVRNKINQRLEIDVHEMIISYTSFLHTPYLRTVLTDAMVTLQHHTCSKNT